MVSSPTEFGENDWPPRIQPSTAFGPRTGEVDSWPVETHLVPHSGCDVQVVPSGWLLQCSHEHLSSVSREQADQWLEDRANDPANIAFKKRDAYPLT